jgi:hypothetical protein
VVEAMLFDALQHGRTPEQLKLNLYAVSLDQLANKGGQIGSKRNYLWTHTLREWPSLDELNHPIRFIWKTPVSLPRKVVRTVRRLRQAHVVFSNNEISHQIEWSTESYLLARNNCD